MASFRPRLNCLHSWNRTLSTLRKFDQPLPLDAIVATPPERPKELTDSHGGPRYVYSSRRRRKAPAGQNWTSNRRPTALLALPVDPRQIDSLGPTQRQYYEAVRNWNTFLAAQRSLVGLPLSAQLLVHNLNHAISRSSGLYQACREIEDVSSSTSTHCMLTHLGIDIRECQTASRELAIVFFEQSRANCGSFLHVSAEITPQEWLRPHIQNPAPPGYGWNLYEAPRSAVSASILSGICH